MRSTFPLVRFVACLLLSVASALALGGPKAKAREEILVLFEQRRVALAVPAGFTFASGKDENGIITAKVGDAKEKVSLQVTFLPDPADEFSNARRRKEFMAQSFQHYVAGSVEQAMQFEELAAASGSGTYCVFTDAKMVGKAPYPPGEYLHSTTGLKSWPGCFVVFTLFSNDTTSPEYRAAMKIVRESIRELSVTPLR